MVVIAFVDHSIILKVKSTSRTVCFTFFNSASLLTVLHKNYNTCSHIKYGELRNVKKKHNKQTSKHSASFRMHQRSRDIQSSSWRVEELTAVDSTVETTVEFSVESSSVVESTSVFRSTSVLRSMHRCACHSHIRKQVARSQVPPWRLELSRFPRHRPERS